MEIGISGTCPQGDECFYGAVSEVLSEHTWNRSMGHLYDFHEVYRAYAYENVRLETDNPVADRFGGKFKSWGKTTAPAVDQVLLGFGSSRGTRLHGEGSQIHTEWCLRAVLLGYRCEGLVRSQ